MVAGLKKPAAGKKDRKPGIRSGRLPTKRTINLVLVDENKINLVKAIPAVLAILVLAALFGKFLVYDRLMAVSKAQDRVAQLQQNLTEAKALMDSYGNVENTYAHYTIEGMSDQELGLVNRPDIMRLVGGVIEAGAIKFDADEFRGRVDRMCALAEQLRSGALEPADFAAQLEAEKQNLRRVEIAVHEWRVTGNVLTIELTGSSLERLNLQARELEEDPIVDTCIINTANKDIRYSAVGNYAETDVRAVMIVYLQQPPEEEVSAS